MIIRGKRLLSVLMTMLLTCAAGGSCLAEKAAGEEQTYWVNPNGGSRFHRVRRCPSINPRYFDGMVEITEAQLQTEPYNQLMPCDVCQDLDPEAWGGSGTDPRQEAGSVPETNSPSYAGDERYTIDLNYGNSCTALHCVEKIPEEANLKRFTDQGWELREGILADYNSEKNGEFEDAMDRGFFALQKDGRRMGVALIRKDGVWEPHPVGPCVLSDREFVLTLQADAMKFTFRIEYESKDGRALVCGFHVDETGLIHLDSYSVTDEFGGNRFSLYADGGECWTWRSSGGETGSTGGSDPRYMSNVKAMLCFEELPDSPETYAAWNRYPFPAGYYPVLGVHLREKTSSHSGDLGLLNPGTAFRMTGMADGDPFPWFQAEIGLLNGYIVSQYVCADDAGAVSGNPDEPLPVAETLRDTKLKSGTGRFDSTIATVPEGVRMHVLSERDGWLYVVIPIGEIGFYMDVDGSYGFIQKDSVLLGNTVYDLER